MSFETTVLGDCNINSVHRPNNFLRSGSSETLSLQRDYNDLTFQTTQGFKEFPTVSGSLERLV